MRTYRGVDIFRGSTDMGTRWYCRTSGAGWTDNAPAILRGETLADMRDLINTYRKGQ